MATSKETQTSGAIVQFKTKVDMSTVPQTVSQIRTIKQRRRAIQTNNLDHIFASRSYMAIIEAVMMIIDEEVDKLKVLTSVLPYMLAISEVEAGALLVSNEQVNGHANKAKLTPVAKQNLPDDVMEALANGNLGAQLLAGQQLWLELDPLEPDTEKELLKRNKLSYLCGLPLQNKGEVLGAIVVSTREKKENLLRQELRRRLVMLAQILTLFLDNIRLRHHRQQSGQTTVKEIDPVTKQIDELEQLLAAVMSAEEEVAHQNTDLGMLNTLSDQVSSTLQLNVILQAAIKQTRSALGAEAGWCYLFKDHKLTMHEYQGISKRYATGMRYLSPNDGVEGMAFSRHEPMLRDGMLFHSAQKARALMQEEGLQNIAAVPLIDGEQTIGVLAVANRHTWTWSSRDKRMLMSIGRQVAHAITNAQKFTTAQKKAQNWQTSYSALQNANKKLATRAKTLEQQIQELRQAEQQIWAVLAASTKARRKAGQGGASSSDDQVANIIKKVLGRLRKKTPG